MTPRRRLVVTALGVILLLPAAVWVWAAATSRRPATVRVEVRDLVIGVEVVGALRAEQSTSVGPPQVEGLWQYKISLLAPEGTEVEAGQPVVGFDTSELVRRLQQRSSEADATAKEVEKKEIDLEIQREADALELAEARARLRKARLVAERPESLVSSLELEQAALDLELAETEVASLTARVDASERAARAELAALRAERDRARSEVERLQEDIRRMQCTAPRAGLVVYVTDWNNQKLKVGDTCWLGRKVLEIPDLRHMAADGEVVEALAGRIRTGQEVSLRLDAYPDEPLSGTVRGIARAVRQRSWRNPVKIVELDIALTGTDPERMRPGMRFRGEVVVERLEGVASLPLEVVETDRTGPYVLRRTVTGRERVEVTLGARTATHVQVLSGLEPGAAVVRPGAAG